MIYFFSGTPGSGKSLDMARCVLNDMRFNRPVITNFDVYPSKRYRNKTLIIKDNTTAKKPLKIIKKSLIGTK